MVSFLYEEVGVLQWKDDDEEARRGEGEEAEGLGVGLKDSGSRRYEDTATCQSYVMDVG